MQSKLFHAGAAAFMAISLAACGGDAEQNVDTAPEAPAGISVSEGRMNLPAVAGNPGAVYFTVENGGERSITIRSAHVQGAESAMLHMVSEWDRQEDMQQVEQLPVEPGGSLVFEPGGYHVMAMGVEDGLEPGGETEVTLTFAGGDKVSFPVRLLAPGDEGAGE